MKAEIIAYLADWGFKKDFPKEQMARLTQINYSFGLIREGRVDVSHWEARERLEQHRRDYPQVRFVLSIGGWGAGGFSEAVATPEGREKLAESGIDFLKEYKLDGLDWDWEYPTSDAANIACAPEDNVNMTDFLVLMRAKLDALGAAEGRYFLQSMAVGAGEERVNDYIWPRAVPALDTVNLMTYDMASATHASHATNLLPSPHAAYSADQAVKAFHKAGVPMEKLVIGSAFYFHGYCGADGAKAVLGQACGQKVRGGSYGSNVERIPECERCWDEAAAAATYITPEGVLLSGDDPESLRRKGEYILENKLAGIIIWELNHDSTCELLECLCATLR